MLFFRTIDPSGCFPLFFFETERNHPWIQRGFQKKKCSKKKKCFLKIPIKMDLYFFAKIEKASEI